MEELLQSSSKKGKPGACKTYKRFMIQPNVIYLKNKRDNVLISTEKRANKVPQDEYGYFGGFSPSRKDVYKNEYLVRRNRD